MKIALALVFAAACGDISGLGTLGADTGIDTGLDPVFTCSFASSGVQLELCWHQPDSAEFAGLVADQCGDTVTCAPSVRVPGGFWHCNGGAGCDALEGCWCPGKHTPCVPNP